MKKRNPFYSIFKCRVEVRTSRTGCAGGLAGGWLVLSCNTTIIVHTGNHPWGTVNMGPTMAIETWVVRILDRNSTILYN